eukprot:11154407-Alexandrium_andersonii.AAC.1
MSASLVGSEMCIRDRSRTCPTPSRRGSRPRGPGATRSQASCWTGRSASVSYTHLTLPTICSV